MTLRVQVSIALLALLFGARPSIGQTSDQAATANSAMDEMPGMDMGKHTHNTRAPRAPRAAHVHPGHMPMTGLFGPYPLSREASGTSWQPDDAEHLGIHTMQGPWMLMLHGMADVVADDQGGARGDSKLYSSNMLMGMAQWSQESRTLGLRAMVSAEPATIGKEGYPLLLQTGETADGRTPLVDRQHPHDALMELAASYSVSSEDQSLFIYGGVPGEPALGPPAFMHRFSGSSFPQAPITHHWLDSSHITYGVLTAGTVAGNFKLEASRFRGREPDENRWDLETPKLDSHSFRLSANPVPSLSWQVSYGRLKSPEQLEPGVDQDRTTASVMREGRSRTARWETTLAWGRNRNRPGHILDAFLVESALQNAGHTLFARAERVEKDELFPASSPNAGRVFEVGELSLGYRVDLRPWPHAAAGLGLVGSLALVPPALRDTYGRRPTSGFLFAHLALR